MAKAKLGETVETLAAPPVQESAPDPEGAAALASAETSESSDMVSEETVALPPSPPKRGRGRPRKDGGSSPNAPRPRRDKSALQLRLDAAEAEVARLRGTNAMERIASNALRPTFEVASGFMHKWRGWEAFSPTEVNALTDGWAPVVAPWLSPDSGPWFGAIMATIAVALPRALKDAGIEAPSITGEPVLDIPGGTVSEHIAVEEDR